MMRKFFIIIILIIFAIQILPWALIFVGMVCEPNPPAPEIKYGEFPLKIEYSVNGEQFVVEDTIICEYDGIGMNEGIGKYRKWNIRLASGAHDIILLKMKGVKEEGYTSEEIDNAVTTLYFDYGTAEDYMGEDKGSPGYYEVSYVIKVGGIVTQFSSLSKKELYEKYGIKIISLEIAPPIKNTFK